MCEMNLEMEIEAVIGAIRLRVQVYIWARSPVLLPGNL